MGKFPGPEVMKDTCKKNNAYRNDGQRFYCAPTQPTVHPSLILGMCFRWPLHFYDTSLTTVNTTFQWVILLLPVQEFPDSNLSLQTGYSACHSLRFSSVPPDNFWDSISNKNMTTSSHIHSLTILSSGNTYFTLLTVSINKMHTRNFFCGCPQSLQLNADIVTQCNTVSFYTHSKPLFIKHPIIQHHALGFLILSLTEPYIHMYMRNLKFKDSLSFLEHSDEDQPAGVSQCWQLPLLSMDTEPGPGLPCAEVHQMLWLISLLFFQEHQVHTAVAMTVQILDLGCLQHGS